MKAHQHSILPTRFKTASLSTLQSFIWATSHEIGFREAFFNQPEEKRNQNIIILYPLYALLIYAPQAASEVGLYLRNSVEVYHINKPDNIPLMIRRTCHLPNITFLDTKITKSFKAPLKLMQILFVYIVSCTFNLFLC